MAENQQWATVDLMGHSQTAGRINMENGLLRVDVPVGDTFRTEYYGMAAIYSIKIMSEEIARAHVVIDNEVLPYDTPIVTREQHQSAMRRVEMENNRLQMQVTELSRRLTSVNALPAITGSDVTDTRRDFEDEPAF